MLSIGRLLICSTSCLTFFALLGCDRVERLPASHIKGGPGVVTWQEIKPVMDRHCTRCHRAGLDLSAFPFEPWSGSQEKLVQEMIRRFRLKTWQRMPPPNVVKEPLSEPEIQLFEAWLASGLPAD